MSDLDRLPWDYPSVSSMTGAAGRKGKPAGTPVDPEAHKRGRNNRSRGNRAELEVARAIPGGRKMGQLALKWDVEVGDYARLQVKKLARRPSVNAVAAAIGSIPDTGDRLRGFVWVEASGHGKRAQKIVWFIASEFASWHGNQYHATDGAGLLSATLEDWVENFVRFAEA